MLLLARLKRREKNFGVKVKRMVLVLLLVLGIVVRPREGTDWVNIEHFRPIICWELIELSNRAGQDAELEIGKRMDG